MVVCDTSSRNESFEIVNNELLEGQAVIMDEVTVLSNRHDNVDDDMIDDGIDDDVDDDVSSKVKPIL